MWGPGLRLRDRAGARIVQGPSCTAKLKHPAIAGRLFRPIARLEKAPSNGLSLVLKVPHVTSHGPPPPIREKGYVIASLGSLPGGWRSAAQLTPLSETNHHHPT